MVNSRGGFLMEDDDAGSVAEAIAKKRREERMKANSYIEPGPSSLISTTFYRYPTCMIQLFDTTSSLYEVGRRIDSIDTLVLLPPSSALSRSTLQSYRPYCRTSMSPLQHSRDRAQDGRSLWRLGLRQVQEAVSGEVFASHKDRV